MAGRVSANTNDYTADGLMTADHPRYEEIYGEGLGAAYVNIVLAMMDPHEEFSIAQQAEVIDLDAEREKRLGVKR